MENQEQNQNKGNVKLMFDVMPQGQQQRSEQQQAQTTPMPKAQGSQDMPPMPSELQGQGDHSEIQPSKSHFKLLIIALIVVALGVGGYFGYMWWQDRSEGDIVTDLPPQQPVGLSSAFLQKYFGSDTCADDSLCGITADPDGDKLTNEEEAEALTSPLLVDSDFDGLADGDELKVYSTEPIISDTDGDGFEDGSEVRNGFSAIVESDKPAAQIELYIIQENIVKFPLHAYTTIYLSLESFKTNFGSEDTTIPQMTIGIPQSFTQDLSTINPIVWSGTASSTLVLSRSIVSATSTLDSLVESAIAANKVQYPDFAESTSDQIKLANNLAVRKGFTFTDNGNPHFMAVVYLKANTALMTAAFIVPQSMWQNEVNKAEAILYNLRAVGQ